jgi:hypothetical protein
MDLNDAQSEFSASIMKVLAEGQTLVLLAQLAVGPENLDIMLKVRKVVDAQADIIRRLVTEKADLMDEIVKIKETLQSRK